MCSLPIAVGTATSCSTSWIPLYWKYHALVIVSRQMRAIHITRNVSSLPDNAGNAVILKNPEIYTELNKSPVFTFIFFRLRSASTTPMKGLIVYWLCARHVRYHTLDENHYCSTIYCKNSCMSWPRVTGDRWKKCHMHLLCCRRYRGGEWDCTQTDTESARWIILQL